MPARYFMNLRYREKVFRDEEGDLLEGDVAVRGHALASAKDMILRTRTDIIHDWFDCLFEVCDEAGRTVLVLPFGDAVVEESDAPADALS